MGKLSPQDVVFSHTSSRDQLTEVWRLNAQEWARLATVEEHIERERELSQQPASGSRWRTWTLTLKEKPDVIIASLETFQHALAVHDDEGYREEVGGKIASVFTNPHYRRNGMAALLLNNVKEWFDGEANAFVSVLYSDIGPDYYARLGWKKESTLTLMLSIEADTFKQQGSDNGLSRVSGVKPLTQADLEELCRLDEARVREMMRNLPKDGKTHWTFLPSFEYFCWHNRREEVDAKLMSKDFESRARGAISESKKAWIIWHFDGAEKKVKVQRIVSMHVEDSTQEAEEVAGLLDFMLCEALSHGFSTSLIWNPSDYVQRAAGVVSAKYDHDCVRVELKDRKDSIPHARLKHDEDQDAIWEMNEYYAWC